MKRTAFSIRWVALVVVAGMVASVGWSQGGDAPAKAAGKDKDVVRIKALKGVGREGLVRTPEFRSSLTRGNKAPQEWGEITVEYDTAAKPKWLDDLTINFYVMTEGKDSPTKYSLFKKTVTYIDIETGRGHMAATYLRPSALKRYGQIIAVAVEVMVGGELVTGETAGEVKGAPKDWWKNEKVTGSKEVVIREGHLLEKNDSPFALVSTDSYEAVR